MTVLQTRLFGLPQTELTSDDYYTPAWVFERMGLTFDLDVCAPHGGVDWVPATRHFDQRDDGLAQPWHGRVWMNPPYSNSSPWARRFIDHRNGVALVPHSRSHWWGELWATADAIADAGMFQFYKPETGKYEPVFMPVVFAAFGAECCEAIANLGPVRRLADG